MSCDTAVYNRASVWYDSCMRNHTAVIAAPLATAALVLGVWFAFGAQANATPAAPTVSTHVAAPAKPAAHVKHAKAEVKPDHAPKPALRKAAVTDTTQDSTPTDDSTLSSDTDPNGTGGVGGAGANGSGVVDPLAPAGGSGGNGAGSAG